MLDKVSLKTIMEHGKKHRFMNIIGEGLSYISQMISSNIVQPLAEGTERVANNIEGRIKVLEKRIFRKTISILVIGFGLTFLTFSLFFFLLEYLGWSKYSAFFSIGIIIFIIGLLLKLGESN